jgi:hypothetical protein
MSSRLLGINGWYRGRNVQAMVFTTAGHRLLWVLLVYHFVGATAAGKGFGFGFKGKAHPQDIAHGFP